MIAALKPYPVYRDSGIEWLEKVPEHWEVRAIKTLFREKDDRSRDGRETLLSLTRQHGIVPQSDVAKRPPSATDLSRYKLCRTGDLVMNRMQAWSGMFAVTPLPGLVSPDYTVFAPRRASEVHVEFFERVFRAPVFVEEFARRSRGIGTGFNRLYTPDFGAVPVVCPPLTEQRSIARFIRAADRRIRRYIRAKEKLLTLLGEQKRAVVHEAVTGRIDVRTGQPYPGYKDSGVEWLGKVPEHWEVRRLKTRMRSVLNPTSSRVSELFCLALEHVESWTGKLRAPDSGVRLESQLRSFIAGDILFGKLRPYLAKVTRPERNGACVGEFLVLRPLRSDVVGSYMERLLRSQRVIGEVSRSAVGAKMPRADWTFLGGIPVPVPPVSEQHAIASYLDGAGRRILRIISAAKRQVALFREYRTRLIADVVTGKLDARKAAANLSESNPLARNGDGARTIPTG